MNKSIHGDIRSLAGTYIPRKEVQVVGELRATIILPNQALKLRARRECTDRDGRQRVTGEEWLVKKVDNVMRA